MVDVVLVVFVLVDRRPTGGHWPNSAEHLEHRELARSPAAPATGSAGRGLVLVPRTSPGTSTRASTSTSTCTSTLISTSNSTSTSTCTSASTGTSTSTSASTSTSTSTSTTLVPAPVLVPATIWGNRGKMTTSWENSKNLGRQSGTTGGYW